MNRNTTCDRVLERLPLYVGQDLDAEGDGPVAAHLAGCAGCRGAAQRASEARARLRAAFEDEVRGGGPRLWPGVRAGLAREGVLRPDRPALRGPWRAAALAAAAACLCALLVPALLRRGGDEGRADLVQGGPIPAEALVAGPGAAPEAGAVAAPAPSGLVPIRDLRDRLPVLPASADPRYELSSSGLR